MSSTAASNLAGMWFGDLAAAVQGTWQAAAAGHGGQQQQWKLLRAGPGPGENKQKAAAPPAAAAGRKAAAEDGGDDVGRCGGAMSDTTLYLLLDRFAPS